VVDVHWAEVCELLPNIEELSEDGTFSGAALAASVASKCFYHLQEYDDALRLALASGTYFDISKSGDEYIEKLLSICIDKYTDECRQNALDSTVAVDPRKEEVIEQMFQRCYRDKCFEQAVGVALDTHRIDKVHEVCIKAIESGREILLDYTFDLCQNARIISSRSFRLQVIDSLVKYYGTLPSPDNRNVCFGLQFLNRPKEVAEKLSELCKGSLDMALEAYQIAFDMQEAENQGFVLQVVNNFAGLLDPATIDEAEAASMNIPLDTYKERLDKLRRVLVESFDVDLTLNFLFRQSKTDLTLLGYIKQSTEGRASALHNATVVAHAYMTAGTTQDTFLRENLQWMRKATNWAKFTAVASMGVVHKGNVHESMNLLQPYLGAGGGAGTGGGGGFVLGGALYALGLMHANKGGAGDSATISYLTTALTNAAQAEVVQHGACLGIGLAAMATGDESLNELMWQVVYEADNAVAGEGAALAIGLVLLGKSETSIAAEAIPRMLNYAHDTPHEKVIRALSIALAMMVYGKEESAEVLIDQLARDRDPIIRYGAMYATAMAYCGTADNNAVKRLLHVAVSDVSDDVRRAAVSCIGFVMFRSHETVPRLVTLLSESFNPHVRYGACMAVGVACAGTAFKDAIDLLSPMLEDQVDFVRQGAMMALAMVLMQASEARSPSVKKLNEHLKKVIGDKHQPPVAKIGAILATGILEAGGRNVVISLQSRAGFLRGGAVVGMMLWLQHWYWYPLMHCISLTFSATMLIGLNKNFEVPKDFKVQCKSPPSMFAYPKPVEKDEKKKLKATAVLSTTARAKAREARKEAKKSGRLSAAGSPAKSVGGDDLAPVPLERQLSNASYISTMSVDQKEGDAETVTPKKEREPSSFLLSNPDRVIPAQKRFLSILANAHYSPIAEGRDNSACTGIVVLRNNDPNAPEDVIPYHEKIAIGQADEADAPEPFEWDPNATDN